MINPLSASEPHADGTESRGLQAISTDVSSHAYSQEIQGEYWALIIGIDDYVHWPKLRTAVNDARALETLLLEKYGFSPDHIISLTDQNATAQALIDAFRDLYYRLEEEDSLLIYYAGHGYLDEFDMGSWIPVDAQQGTLSEYIGTDRINSMITKLRARHIFLVADACYSGSLLATRGVSTPSTFKDRYFSENFRRTSRQVLTSGGLEVVTDTGFDNHSIFAYHFLRELTYNNQPFLAASDLSARVENLVIRNANQAPRWSRLRNSGDEDGEFFFLQRDQHASLPLDSGNEKRFYNATQNSPQQHVSLHATPTNHKKTASSRIDWEKGYVEVTEIGTADTSLTKNSIQAELIALKSARHLGYSRLIEVLRGVNILNDSQYKEAILNRDVTTVESSGILRGVEVVSESVSWQHSAPKAIVTLRLKLAAPTASPPLNTGDGIKPQPNPFNVPEAASSLPVSQSYK